MIALSNVTIPAAGAEGPVVRGLSFRIEEGSWHEIVGPSGAGKSALFEVMTLRTRPGRGSVVVAGRNVDRLEGDELAEVRRDVGSCCQQPVLLKRRTPVENTVLPMVVRGRTDRAARAAEEALGFLGVSAPREAPVEALPAQQRMLVALARATVGSPPVVVVDAVHERLEPAVRGVALSWLEKLHDQGCTVVVLGRRPMNRRSEPEVWRLRDGGLDGDSEVS